MELLWSIESQQAIKPISKNRASDFARLAEEVQINDLQPLIGYEFFQYLIQNASEEWNAKLLEGGTYTYNGYSYIYSGLKYVLSYFLYSRYIGVSNEFDTFSGYSEKNMQDSRHADLGIVKNRQTAIRKIAMDHFLDCEKFMIANSSHFPRSNYNPVAGVCCRKKTILYF